jgi:hypothetical protein
VDSLSKKWFAHRSTAVGRFRNHFLPANVGIVYNQISWRIMQANIICKSCNSVGTICLLFFGLIIAMQGCKVFESETGQRERLPAVNLPLNQFTIPGQVILSDVVRSIRLNRSGISASAPIIELGSNDRLMLQFEMLQFESSQFRIRFSHHNPDWSRSPIPPEFFIDGLYTNYFGGGKVSQGPRPQYRQYEYEFPNRDFNFTRSGNYMLSVEDQDTGFLVFSLPFFVMENRGSIVSSVEKQIIPRRDMRISHRPVSLYTLPDFVDQPQFDLEFYYVQNQFWGRSRRATELDFSAPNEVHFEMDRNRPFIGDYEFLELRLRDLTQNNPQVLEARPDEIPPRVILFDDVSGFSSTGRLLRFGRYGNPNMRTDANYANVVFNFDAGDVDPDTEMYVVGDFNNWSIRSGNKMQFTERMGRWQNSTIIKEGVYNYKYVLIEDGEIDDLYFDDLFTRTPQEYHAFVYMRDSQEFYYRLLQINHFFSGS